MKQFHSSDVSPPVSMKETLALYHVADHSETTQYYLPAWHSNDPGGIYPPSQREQCLPFSTTIMTVVFTQGCRIL